MGVGGYDDVGGIGQLVQPLCRVEGVEERVEPCFVGTQDGVSLFSHKDLCESLPGEKRSVVSLELGVVREAHQLLLELFGVIAPPRELELPGLGEFLEIPLDGDLLKLGTDYLREHRAHVSEVDEVISFVSKRGQIQVRRVQQEVGVFNPRIHLCMQRAEVDVA